MKTRGSMMRQRRWHIHEYMNQRGDRSTSNSPAGGVRTKQQKRRPARERSRSRGRLHRIASEMLPLLLVSFVVLAARSSLADHYVIPTGSMEYTLIPGDHVLVDKLTYGARIPFAGYEIRPGDLPERGDVVIFDSPEDGIRLIKRVVAVEGDRVNLRAGELHIDGQSLRVADSGVGAVERFGDHVARLNLRYGGGPDVARLAVPPGKLLVVGDSRGNSRDGRYFGLIDTQIVYGKATHVIYRKGEGLVWKPL